MIGGIIIGGVVTADVVHDLMNEYVSVSLSGGVIVIVTIWDSVMVALLSVIVCTISMSY